MSDGSSSGAQPGQSSADGGSQLWRGLRQMLFGGDHETSLRDQIEEAIAEHDEDQGTPGDGDLSPIERQMVRNLLHFGERTADDVGVPRSDIVAVPEDASFRTLVELFADAGHSRLPVFRGSLDTVVGMVHIKDVFAILAKGGPDPAGFAELIREPIYVPQSMGALDLLAEMRATRTHLAVVIDEYSGTEGLVTIEDLVEEIVGDIEDEHDEAAPMPLVEVEPGLWDADARAELETVGTLIDPRLAEVEGDIDTLGGLALMLAGHVPHTGDMLAHDSGWRIEVVEADDRRVRRLRLHAPVAEVPEVVEG